MSRARRENTVAIGERQVTIREPLVDELLGLLKQFREQDGQSQDVFGDHVLGELSFREIEMFTTLSATELGLFTLSELAEIGKACREFNPLFFAWKDQLVRAIRSQPSSAASSPAPSI
ncbi:MAG: hypothetical protein HQL98_15600 [Magnetococcales bacterium]|nr:hypothetical protein [Magnetococcales bacterium]